jgi:hypothetical protein
VLFALAAALCAAPGSAQTGEAALPSIRVGGGTASIRVDGVLDERAWTTANAIPALTMIEPTEGAMPALATTIRIIVEPTALFIGVTCADADPQGIVSFTKQRDGSLRNEDNVKIVLRHVSRRTLRIRIPGQPEPQPEAEDVRAFEVERPRLGKEQRKACQVRPSRVDLGFREVGTGDASLDITQRVGPNLVSSLSINISDSCRAARCITTACR